ncbi:pseudouridine synthase [Fibrivirga algicola]|uniref:Pseudouridine synthase n=1 Tax=Fibrivirga algicola TaxID=2950420 RepID=A0ABX0Q9Z2_9BACT|nr:pseudouridine synthase [Fibrivirga algicola]NID09024.1 pseudouridine synthase [Fibrivirga algicola]
MKRDKDSNDRRDGKGRPEGRRDDVRGGFNKGDSRPSFGGPRSGGADRPAYGDKKPFNRNGGSDRPAYGDRKPFNREGGDRPAYGDRKPFAGGDRREGGDRPAYGDRKPFNREGGSDRPERKPFNRDGGSDRPAYGDRKPFAGGDRREGGDRPAYGDRKPFSRDGGDRPAYGDRNAGPRKPFNRDGGSDRPAYGDRKPFTGGDRREGGDRPAYGDRKPFTGGDRREGGDRPAYGDRKPFTGGDRREGGDRPAYGDRNAEPRKPFSRDARSSGPREGDSARFDRRDREGSDERPERKPFARDDRQGGGAERSFERKPYSRDDRSDDRPRFDRRNEGSAERPERTKFEPRDPNGPARPRTTGNRNDGPRKPFDRDRDNRNDEGEEKSIERRTGRYEKAPNYNLSSMRDNLPRSRKVAKNLERERTTDPNSIRLNRYIANAGVCSRREADELIAKGDVQVNGNVVTEMGYRVKPNDVVKYGNKVLNPEKLVYVLLNKPRDIITTTEDPEERSTVLDLVADAGPFRLYPVGRLDRNTTGLLLLTNDGELAGKLTHPSNNVKKVYQVELDKPITEEHFEAIRNGLDLEDGHIKPDDLAIVTPDAQVVGVEIHSGRNRIVRRMFESLGYEVTKLDRTVFAGLTKKELPRGKWRFLEPKEVVKLKYLI